MLLMQKKTPTYTVSTQNINEERARFAKKLGIQPGRTDFDLMGVVTYAKTRKDESFVKLSPRQWKTYLEDREAIIRDQLNLKQVYQVRIRPAAAEKHFQLKYEIDPGPYNAVPQMVLSNESILPVKLLRAEETAMGLKKRINKIMAVRKMIVGVFSQQLQKGIKRVVTKAYKGYFDHPETLILFDGIDPLNSVEPQLIEHYKENQPAKRTYEIDANELVIEYIKPVIGEPGFDAFGRFISSDHPPKTIHMSFTHDPKTVRREEDLSGIRFYSIEKGYVVHTKSWLAVPKQLMVDQVKQVQDKISENEGNEIEVVVTQNDVTRDGVGEGTELVSHRVNITGFVGKGAVIKAKELTIEGQSHASSKMFAKNAVVNRHKGILRAHHARVLSLEGGEVHATEADIETVLNGSVYGEYVTIGRVKNHAKIYGARKITIGHVSGEDNRFVIDPSKISTYLGKRKYLEKEVKAAREEAEEKKRNGDEEGANEALARMKKLYQELKATDIDPTDTVVEIKGETGGINTVEFIYGKNKQLSYRIVHPSIYEPFRLEEADEEMILKPVGVTAPL